MKLSAAAIARITGGKVYGHKNFVIKKILPPDAATKNDLTFLFERTTKTLAGVVIGREIIPGKISIVVKNTKIALYRLLKSLAKSPGPNFIAATAIIEKGSKVPKAIMIDHGVVIKCNSKVGTHTWIGVNSFIGSNVKVGSHCHIYPNSAILDNTEIGDHVVVGSGTVIGSPGFGFIKNRTYQRYNHIGTVTIEDYVEIGANCTIDRATMGKTIVGAGTKIDNLVHIAHNVKIGKNCLIMGQCGIAGSARLGDRVVLCGQVGISDHVEIGDGAIIYAKSAVFRTVRKNLRVSGIPAREHESVLRALARLYRDK